MPRLLTEHEQDLVIECLAEGYGVEDIHVLHGLPADSVRALIRDTARSGLLSEIYEKKGGKG